jgi:flagellar assembly protein FliH
MPLSSRRIPADLVGVASPFRMNALGSAAAAATATAADEARDVADAAFRKGFEAGRAATLADAKREHIRAEAILDSHERELGRLNDDLARAVIALAVDLAAHVTRAHLAVREDAVFPVVRDAIDLLRDDAAPARLYLNPADCAIVERSLGAELAQRGCRIIPDVALAHGECRLEGAQAEVDATLAARWRKALAPLGGTHDWIG